MLDWQMIALAITHIAYGLIIEHRYNGKNKAATCGELPAFIVLLANGKIQQQRTLARR